MVDQPVTITAILRDQLSKPLEKAGAAVAGIAGKAQELARTIDPALAKLTALASGVAAAFAIDKALDLAKEEVQAEQQLLVALDGRSQAQAEILAQTREISKATNVQNAELVRAAALMKNIGVNARDLPRTLRVAADTASALQIPIELVARGIASIGEGGTARGLIQSIPGLKDVIKDGQTLNEVLEILEGKFKGTAEAAAQTGFGRVDAQLKRVSDSSEEFGKRIVGIKLAILTTVADVVEALQKAVSSPAGTAVITLLEKAAPALVIVGALVTGIAAAVGSITTIALVVGNLVAVAPSLETISVFVLGIAAAAPVLGTLVGILAAAAAAGAAIGFAILKIIDPSITIKGTWSDILDVFGAVFGQVSEIIAKIVSGRLTIDDLFDFFKVRVAQAGLLIASLADAATVAFGKIKSLVTGAALLGNLPARVLLPFLPSDEDVQAAELRIGEIANGVVALDGSLEVSQAASTERLVNGRIAAIEKEIAAERKKGERIVANTKALADDLSSIKLITPDLLSSANVSGLTPEKVRTLLKSIDATTRESLVSVLDKKFDDQLKDEQISFARYLDLRRAADESLAQKGALDQDARSKALEREIALLEQRKVLIDDQVQQVQVEAPNVSGDLQEQIAKDVLALEKERVEVVGEIDDRQAELAKVSKAEQENVLKILATEEQLRDVSIKRAESTLDLLKKQTTELEAQAKSGAEAFSAGGITRAELTERLGSVLDQLGDRARAARENLNGILAAAPDLKPQIDKLIAELEKEIPDLNVRIKVTVAEAEAGAAKKALDEALKGVEQKLSDGRIDAKGAVDQVEAATQAAAEQAANLRVQLFDALTTPNATVETADKIRTITAALKEIGPAAEAASIAIATDLERGVEKAAGDLQTKLAGIAEQRQGGAITSSDAFRQRAEALREFGREADEAKDGIERLAAAHPELNDQLQTLADRLQAIKDKNLPDEAGGIEGFFSAVGVGAENTVDKLSNVQTAGQQFGEALVNGFGDFVEVLARGQQSLGDFARNFVANLAIMIAKLLAFNALKGVLGLFGGGGVPAPGDANFIGPVQPRSGGGPILRFDEGGWVPGPPVHRDVVRAMLTPGEHVMDEATVALYGADYMNAIWKHLIPPDLARSLMPHVGRAPLAGRRNYDSGGEVAGGSFGAGARRPERALVVGDDQGLERMLHGGDQAFMRFAQRNSSELLSVLGLGGLGRV